MLPVAGGEVVEAGWVAGVAAAAGAAAYLSMLAVDVVFEAARSVVAAVRGRPPAPSGPQVVVSGHVGVHRLEGQTRRMMVR